MRLLSLSRRFQLRLLFLERTDKFVLAFLRWPVVNPCPGCVNQGSNSNDPSLKFPRFPGSWRRSGAVNRRAFCPPGCMHKRNKRQANQTPAPHPPLLTSAFFCLFSAAEINFFDYNKQISTNNNNTINPLALSDEEFMKLGQGAFS